MQEVLGELGDEGNQELSEEPTEAVEAEKEAPISGITPAESVEALRDIGGKPQTNPTRRMLSLAIVTAYTCQSWLFRSPQAAKIPFPGGFLDNQAQSQSFHFIFFVVQSVFKRECLADHLPQAEGKCAEAICAEAAWLYQAGMWLQS